MQALALLPGIDGGEEAELLEVNLLGNSAPGVLHFVRGATGWVPSKGWIRQQQIKYRLTTTAELLADCIRGINGTSDTSHLVDSGQLVFQGNPSIGRLVFINDWVQDLKLIAPLRLENPDS